jgi:hypothetical protein
MKITRQWWHPWYPYKVEWREAYRLHYIRAANGGSSYPVGGPIYIMDSGVQEFLERLSWPSFLGIKRPATLYQYKTGRLPFTMKSSPAGLVLGRDPPAIRMARRGDALMLKMTLGGQ